MKNLLRLVNRGIMWNAAGAEGAPAPAHRINPVRYSEFRIPN